MEGRKRKERGRRCWREEEEERWEGRVQSM